MIRAVFRVIGWAVSELIPPKALTTMPATSFEAALLNIETANETIEPRQENKPVMQPIPSAPSWWYAKYRDMPIFQLDPMMNDDDVDFTSDIIYLRSLLSEMVDAAHYDGFQPAPLLDVELNAYAWDAFAALEDLRAAETVFAEVTLWA